FAGLGPSNRRCGGGDGGPGGRGPGHDRRERPLCRPGGVLIGIDTPYSRAGTLPAMSVKPMNENLDGAHAASEEPATEQPHSWLAALRARLGLPGAPTLRAMLEDALKGAGDGRAFSAEEREMLLRILRFGALHVVDVMVPRADIIAVDENEPVWELLKTFDAAGVSRLPLFRE